jgi:methylenetetrahydrofolate dehydrogenase (NADP+)/methenyltetrahydrofolate cyclohydrolase
MSARIIDGKAAAADLRMRIAAEVRRLAAEHGLVPGLAVVLVGADPASEAYVRGKSKASLEVGMRAFDHRLPVEVPESELLELVARLNADPAVHGVLVQLPLPARIDRARVIAAVDPAKDVDGFHPFNLGRLAAGLPSLTPCTPQGCVILAKSMHPRLEGLEAIVLGRSVVVGRPLAYLLLNENATVTIAHSMSRDLPAVCRRADLVFAAVGRPGLVGRDWIKPGATVIDVGISREVGSDGKARLIGDVAFQEVAAVAGALTPVPGGVGPMTIACLLANTIRAACASAGLPPPHL